jgi:hypothetical protein
LSVAALPCLLSKPCAVACVQQAGPSRHLCRPARWWYPTPRLQRRLHRRAEVQATDAMQDPHAIWKGILIGAAILWSMHASVPFVAGSVGPQRHILAVYPMALMYAVLGWLIFISGAHS